MWISWHRTQRAGQVHPPGDCNRNKHRLGIDNWLRHWYILIKYYTPIHTDYVGGSVFFEQWIQNNWATEKKKVSLYFSVIFVSVFSFRCFLGRAANNRPQGQGRSSRAGRQRNLTKPKSVCSLTSKLLQLPHSNSNALTRTTIRDELMPRIIVRFCAAFVSCSSNCSSYPPLTPPAELGIKVPFVRDSHSLLLSRTRSPSLAHTQRDVAKIENHVPPLETSIKRCLF